MKNIKIEQSLSGPEHWSGLGTITVPGDPRAQQLPPNLPFEKKEEIIQSWNTVAVSRLRADGPVRLGFIADGHAEFLVDPIGDEDGLFGVHIGPKETTFVVWPEDNQSPTQLELVETTTADDPKYPTLPLY
jgi:hypothetical protein